MTSKRQHPEDLECKALWEWAQHVTILRDYLYHIPNGSKRTKAEAGILKAMGTRSGVHDYNLPIARGGYIGCWIEMKPTRIFRSKVSTEQMAWARKMEELGHFVAFCYGWEEAKDKLQWYILLPPTQFALGEEGRARYAVL